YRVHEHPCSWDDISHGHVDCAAALMPAIELTLAAIEQALSQEIQRRIDLETRIAGQVEAGLRQAARRATGVVEEQLATAQRQHAEELRLRLSALERSVGSLQRQSTPKDGSPTTAPGTFERQLSWLESRITGLEQLFQKPLEMLPLEVARQLQLIRGELFEEAASRRSVSYGRGPFPFRFVPEDRTRAPAV
ncbi:unnamed protein product, partial [Durusdinium trenchii]